MTVHAEELAVLIKKEQEVSLGKYLINKIGGEIISELGTLE
jgi:hypothetical protein